MPTPWNEVSKIEITYDPEDLGNMAKATVRVWDKDEQEYPGMNNQPSGPGNPPGTLWGTSGPFQIWKGSICVRIAGRLFCS
jgi:hypothetical protein